MANFIETDMVPIGKFLANSKLLKVPSFQRSYAWGADQVSQIWEDIVEAMQSESPRDFRRLHFLKGLRYYLSEA